jgi:hypothetical protein
MCVPLGNLGGILVGSGLVGMLPAVAWAYPPRLVTHAGIVLPVAGVSNIELCRMTPH